MARVTFLCIACALFVMAGMLNGCTTAPAPGPSSAPESVKPPVVLAEYEGIPGEVSGVPFFCQAFASPPYAGNFCIVAQSDGTLAAVVIFQQPLLMLDDQPTEFVNGVPTLACVTRDIVVTYVRRDGVAEQGTGHADSANSVLFSAPSHFASQDCGSIRLERHFRCMP